MRRSDRLKQRCSLGKCYQPLARLPLRSERQRDLWCRHNLTLAQGAVNGCLPIREDPADVAIAQSLPAQPGDELSLPLCCDLGHERACEVIRPFFEAVSSGFGAGELARLLLVVAD